MEGSAMMKLVEVQAILRLYIEAKVLKPEFEFVGLLRNGEYPIVLIHSNFEKNLTKEQAEKYKHCTVEWLVSVDLDKSFGPNQTLICSDAMNVLNEKIYGENSDAESDDDLWRIDAIKELDDTEPIGVVKIDAIDGFGISSLSESKTLFSIFGKAGKIVQQMKVS